MSSNAITSPQERQAVTDNGGNSNLPSVKHKQKKLLIIASFIGLAILVVIILSLTNHVKGDQGSISNVKAASTDNSTPKVTQGTASNSNTTATSTSASTPSSNPSSVNIKLNSTSTSSSNSAGNSSTSDLTVNGQHVQTSGGNVNEHYTSSDGSTTVNISEQNNSTSGGSSSQ